MKINKREIIAFVLGFMTLFLIETILDWNSVKQAYNKGFEAGQTAVK